MDMKKLAESASISHEMGNSHYFPTARETVYKWLTKPISVRHRVATKLGVGKDRTRQESDQMWSMRVFREVREHGLFLQLAKELEKEC